MPLEDAADAAPFLAAFGPEVGIWARVVDVETPIALRLVLAPIGEQWRVVGVESSKSRPDLIGLPPGALPSRADRKTTDALTGRRRQQ